MIWLAWGARVVLSDPRFLIAHDSDPEYSLLTRSSDGQMLFLANMLSKMKRDTTSGQSHCRGPQWEFFVHWRRRAG